MANFNPLGYTGRITASVSRLGVCQFNPAQFTVNSKGVVSLSGGSSEVLTINSLPPTAGNIVIEGTASQITASNAGSTVTLSIPAIAANTTSFTSGSFITSSATLGTTYTVNSITPSGSNANIDLLVNGKGTGGVIHSRSAAAVDITIEATNSDNTSGSSRAGFEAAVGGASAGDPYVNFLVSGAGVYTMGIDNSVSDNFVLAASAALGTSNIASWTSAGALTNAAGITATAGDITATLGNVIIDGAAKQLRIHGGAVTDFIGQAVLVNGTVTVANTNIATTDRIIVTRSAKNGSTAYGTFVTGITGSTSFTITSAKSDTTTETDDASTVDYIIVRQV